MKRPYWLLVIVLIVTICGSILAYFLTQKGNQTGPTSPLTNIGSSDRQPTPAPPLTSKKMDSNRHEILKQKAMALYTAIENRNNNYQTVQIRTRFLFPTLLHKNPPLETEIRFDADRKNQRWVFTVFKSVPQLKQDPLGEWVFQPDSGIIVSSTKYRSVQYYNARVFDVVLSATDQPSLIITKPKLKEIDDQFRNPYMDLFMRVPYSERFTDYMDAKEESTEQGTQLRVRFRINNTMQKYVKSNRYSNYFPTGVDQMKALTIREDILQVNPPEFRRVTYYMPDNIAFVVQEFMDVKWDQSIPDDRFQLDEPSNADYFNMNEVLAERVKNQRPFDPQNPSQEFLEMIDKIKASEGTE